MRCGSTIVRCSSTHQPFRLVRKTRRVSGLVCSGPRVRPASLFPRLNQCSQTARVLIRGSTSGVGQGLSIAGVSARRICFCDALGQGQGDPAIPVGESTYTTPPRCYRTGSIVLCFHRARGPRRNRLCIALYNRRQLNPQTPRHKHSCSDHHSCLRRAEVRTGFRLLPQRGTMCTQYVTMPTSSRFWTVLRT